MKTRVKSLEEIINKRVDTLSLMKLFLYHNPSAIVMLDKNQKMMLWSKKFARDFFVLKDKANYQFMDLKKAAPKAWELIEKKNMFKLSLEGESFEGFLGVNGSRKYYSYDISPWITEGCVEGVIITFNDITELKKTQEKLIISEYRFTNLLELMGDWVWEVDKYGRYTFCSYNLKNLLGFNCDEIIGKSIFDSIVDEDRKNIESIITEYMKEKKPFHNVVNWNYSKNGKRVCLLSSGTPILDGEGNLLGYRGVDRLTPCDNNPICWAVMRHSPKEEIEKIAKGVQNNEQDNEN